MLLDLCQVESERRGGRLEMVNMAPLAMDGRRLRNGEVRLVLGRLLSVWIWPNVGTFSPLSSQPKPHV